MSQPEDFIRTLEQTADILEGNRPAMGDHISESVKRLILKIDYDQGLKDLRRATVPKDILPTVHGIW